MYTNMDNILNYAKKINNIEENEYFINLTQVANLDNFISSQVHFVNAIDNWSKILGIMISRVPSYNERNVLIQNLVDEHGNGEIEKNHVSTFDKFIDSLLEITKKNKDTYLLKGNYNYTKEFIESLYSLTELNWIFAISAMGMIEFTYINVSNKIHNYVCNYIDKDKINHYSLHEILDVTHATELFKIIEPYYKENKMIIEKGIEKGYNMMNKLYSNYYLDLSQKSI